MSLLTGKGIEVRFDDRRVLDGVDIGLGAGELVGLIGPNGAGKSTLLRVLANLLAPDAGEVLYQDRPLREVGRRRFAREVAYLAQNAPLHWPLTVRRLAALGRLPWLGPWQRSPERDERAIDAALVQADIASLAERPVTTLSGGERLRALLARALASEPRVLLADEPIAALDPFHQLHVMQVLRDLANRGGAALAVLHDLTLAARFCDRLVLLHEGRCFASGSAEVVLNAANLAAVYRVEAQFGHANGQLYVVPWLRLESAEARQ